MRWNTNSCRIPSKGNQQISKHCFLSISFGHQGSNHLSPDNFNAKKEYIIEHWNNWHNEICLIKKNEWNTTDGYRDKMHKALDLCCCDLQSIGITSIVKFSQSLIKIKKPLLRVLLKKNDTNHSNPRKVIYPTCYSFHLSQRRKILLLLSFRPTQYWKLS